MSASGCYTLNLTCDEPDCPETNTAQYMRHGQWEDFIGGNRREAWRAAKEHGWRVYKGKHKCPVCSGAINMDDEADS